MGLYPVEGNWYAKYVKKYHWRKRTLFSYLKMKRPDTLSIWPKISKPIMNKFHKWLAKRINGASFSESEMLIKHHYYMPTENSIALGTFAEPIGAQVPIFSAPGRNIYIFEIGKITGR